MLAGIRSILNNPKWRTWIFITVVLLFYYTRTRLPQPIYDIQIVGNHAVLAVGRTGVMVVDTKEPERLQEVATLDTYGSAFNIQVIGSRVYVADGFDGVKLLSIENEGLDLLGGFRTPGDALDIAVQDSNTFVIDSKEDLLVLKTNEVDGTFLLTSFHDIPDKAEKIKIEGNRAFVSNNKNRFLVIDISAPNNPNIINQIDLDASIDNFVILGDYAYIASENMGLVILDISNENELSIAGQYNQLRNAHDVDVRGSFAYIAVRNEGYAVLDISDFNRITEIGRESTLPRARLVRIVDNNVFATDDLVGLKSFDNQILYKFREQEVVKAQGLYEDLIVKGNLAYIAAGDTGVKVIDVANLNTPLSGTYIDNTNDYATSLDIQGDYLYVTYRQKGMRQYNIGEDPWTPTSEGVEASIPGEPQDIQVVGKMVYIAGGSAGLQILDLSDIASPDIYSLDTPGTAKGVFVLGNNAYIADGEAGLQIVAVNNPQSPVILQNINTLGDATSVYVTSILNANGEQRTYAFIANGGAGLLIVDITDINQPVNVATYTTEGSANDVIVQGNILYLLSEGNGLILLDISTINEPVVQSVQPTPGKAKRIDLREDALAFIADYDRGMRIIRISDPVQPVEIGFFDIPVTARVLLVRGNQGFMVDGNVGLWILDMSDPQSPAILSLFPTPGEALNLTLVGNIAFIADGSAGLQVVNISNLINPQLEGSFLGIDNAVDVAVRGSNAFVITGERRGLHILDITDPTNITEVGFFTTAGNARSIATYENYAFILEGTSGMEVVNIQDPKDPSKTSIGNEFDLEDARSILFLSDHAFIADGPAGMKVYSLESPSMPEFIYSFPILGGFATSLTIADQYVFVAADGKGILPFDVLDLNNIHYSGVREINDQGEIPGDDPFRASSIAVLPDPTLGSKRYINYITSTEFGLQIFQANGNAFVHAVGMVETPGAATFLQVVQAMPRVAYGILTGHPEIVEAKIWKHLGYMLYGTLLFAGLFILYLVLLSQFVLPVQTWREGVKAITRLYASLMGEHGPVVFIKEGEIIARPDELDRNGPGVARVDLNSAIVFEKRALLQPQYRQRYNRYIKRTKISGKKIPRARVEGPGVHFIEPYENIHGVADLRPQFRIRPEVHAYTRDGIEVSNPVWILFTLGQPPEIIDVTYEGERKAKNLRVIHLVEKDIPVREIDQILDKEDTRYYQRYQITRRFFQKSKEIFSPHLKIKDEINDKDRDAFEEVYIPVKKLADSWQVLEVLEVNLFLEELENKCVNYSATSSHSIVDLHKDAHLLADQKLREIMNDFYEKVNQGRKQRGVVVNQLTDEIDPDDQEEIHRYIQTKTEIKYFETIKSRVSKVSTNSSEGDEVFYFISGITHLAIRWEIQNRTRIRHFVDCVSALALELDSLDEVEVKWFVYHVGMIADELANEGMIHFYEYLNLKMVEHYKNGLRDLENETNLSKFAREAIYKINQENPSDDDIWLFNLNALALQSSIHPELVLKLEELRSDPANEVEIEILENALEQLDHTTSNLVRTKYPFVEFYSLVADLRFCFSKINKISQKINLRDTWEFPYLLKLNRLRRHVRAIQNRIQDFDNLGDSEFDRYIEIVEIDDFVEFVRNCVQQLQQKRNNGSGASSELKSCISNIKRKIQLLDQNTFSRYRRSVQNLVNWTTALSPKRSVYIYYYAKQVDKLWQKIEEDDKSAVRQYIRSGRANIAQIKSDILKFESQFAQLEDQGEVRLYQQYLDEIRDILKDCKISERLLGSRTKRDSQNRVGPFQFVRRRVLAAIYSKALDVDQEGEYMPWTDLPVHAAAQTYRDMVSKEQYDYLYEPKDPNKFNLPKLKGNFLRAMRNQGVLAFRYIDHRDGEDLTTGSEWAKEELIKYQSQELKNPKVLRARGIKVIASGFPDLFPVSPKVPEQWLETWRAPLESRAIDIRGKHQLQAMRVINQSRAQAQRDMAYNLARILQSSQSEEALAMRVFQALESTAIDQDTRQFLPRDTMYLLRGFKQWFLPDRSEPRFDGIGDFNYSEDRQLLDE